MKFLEYNFRHPGRVTIGGAPEGFDVLVLAGLVREGFEVVFVARDDVRASCTADALGFFAPEVDRLAFPAWDCLPYDRISPRAEIAARRMEALTRLADATLRPQVVLTTVSALAQRVPPRTAMTGLGLEVAARRQLGRDRVTALALHGGYHVVETVVEPGEVAVRGGIVDIFPPGHETPLRLDFFGDEVESVRAFDPATQRSTGSVAGFRLKPVSEVPLDHQAIERFRSSYRALFGSGGDDDPLYEAVSAGRRQSGMEHWLPLFYERLDTLLDYVPEAVVVLDYQAEDARNSRFALIDEYYRARCDLAAGGLAAGGTVYRPPPPQLLYLDATEWDRRLGARPVGVLTPFAPAEGQPGTVDAGGRSGRDFAEARVQPGRNVFDALGEHVKIERTQGRRVLIAAHSAGSRDRLASILREHGIGPLASVVDRAEAEAQPVGTVVIAAVGLEHGFVAPGLAVISEQDLLGDRLARPAGRRARPENVIAEASSLSPGDLVVHVDHGIGRYDGLATLEVAGAPHDCLRILYDGGDRLFVPVENIEVLGRYGSEEAAVALDRLGSASWQARKARLKRRIHEMAEELIKVAAARALRPAFRIPAPDALFDEFCARFPFDETEDQGRTIDETLADLTSGHPMDRLVCGDVGFGKTEVALRAAFATAIAGRQVAVVVPTTLLARQHFQTFRERMAEFPFRVEQLSRLVPAKRAQEIKAALATGAVDIVVGTHALLAPSVHFSNLGLLVVDEEQHFGVAHKERLKQMRADVHVLTLTATPIPRTLQMALTGVRELSLITTPPVDRLAVRTFVLPYDPVVVREALMRERYRGGQAFYVCPRIEDLDGARAHLAELVPEVSVVIAHGRMPARRLEEGMTAFYDRRYDVLLSTDIIESGLDLPAVNTIIIHRADRFGLAQLYQLRGRVGRSKVRAYAYLTLPPGRTLSAAATKRLEVMQALDSLGAGFSLASHDLDIRGAGNLLGGEQSGHIREVGIELYQRMLEEAVAEARGLETGRGGDDWSPQINIGLSVLIPEAYVPDLGLRMGLYRRIAAVTGDAEVEALGAEMIDRFGPLPDEVENLLATVAVKCLCRRAGVDKLEAGPKGAVVSFRGDSVANLAGLVAFISAQAGTARLRSDHKLVLMRAWDDAPDRLDGVRRLMRNLAEIAAA